MRNKFYSLLKENKSFLLFMFLMCVFRSSFADWNSVPTGSMKPTILEGDRILVNKLAYDIQLPFTNLSLFKLSDPVRGDIVIINSKASQNRLVKRVIGVPGDVVEMKDNVLSINGTELEYQSVSSRDGFWDKLENLVGVEHFVRVNNAGSAYSNFSPVVVPQGFYIALGDNRDNSSDSRVFGFIPRGEIIGRTKKVVMSLNYENHYIPRKNRFFHAL